MKNCLECKKSFKPSSRHKLCPRCRSLKKKKPCLGCGKLVWGNSMRCIKCLGLLQRLPDGKKVKSHNGYVYIKKRDHPRSRKQNGYIFEHIVVMEESMGRYLDLGENVHHINGIRDDNRIENLELWTRPQPIGIRVKDAVLWAKQILERYEGKEVKNEK